MKSFGKKIVFLIVFFIALFIVEVSAESMKLTWLKSFNGENQEEFSQVICSVNGGYIAVGNSSSVNCDCGTNGFQDAIIVKYSNDGVLEWSNHFGDAGYEKFFAVTELEDGSLIAIGYADSPKIAINGGSDAIVVKYNQKGEFQWSRVYGGVQNSLFFDVEPTLDGGFAVVGESSSTINKRMQNYGDTDAIIVKYNGNGDIEWEKNFGGSNLDVFKQIKQVADGSLIVVGNSESNLTKKIKSNGESDGIIVKYSNKGRLLWQKSFGGMNNDYFDGLEVLKNGNFLVIGHSESKDILDIKNGLDAIALLYDDKGNVLDTLVCGGSGDDYFNEIDKIDENGFLIVGKTNSTDIEGLINDEDMDGWMLEYILDENNKGRIRFQKIIGGVDYDAIRALDVIDEKNFIIVGLSKSKDVEGMEVEEGYEAVIAKYQLIREGDLTAEKEEIISIPDLLINQEKQKAAINQSISRLHRIIIGTVLIGIVGVLGVCLLFSKNRK